jgi:AraC family transcriptional regulator
MNDSDLPKYGLPLTGSDWIGLPLRIGHVPESGKMEELESDTDAILIWTGGPSDVEIHYRDPGATETSQIRFHRVSGTMDLLPRNTSLKSIVWRGEASCCISVNLPEATLIALCSAGAAGLDPKRGARFALVDAHVVDLVQRLQAQAEGEEIFGAVYIQSLSLALASYISARYGIEATSNEDSRRSVLSKEQRHQLETFIEQQISTDFGLVDLASIAGYCPDHFSRLFKQAFDQSPHQYVLSRRVELAKVMLRDGKHPIAEIASACGFANQGHLTTAFKRRTGTTPGVYRKV